MKKKAISNLLFAFCAISLAIAVYQIVDSRPAASVLSIVYSLVFLVGGVATRRD